MAFNNAYRRVLIVSHAMTMQRQCMYVKFWYLVFVIFWHLYVKFWYNNFEAINVNYIYGFTQRLALSTNLLIIKIEKPWIVRIDIGISGNKLCMLQQHEFRLQMLYFIASLIIIM